MNGDPEPPPGLDITAPRAARVYDYLLGGKNHFEADRQTAAAVLQSSPFARVSARENRAFLGRAVRYLAAEAGIRQFLDIGTGLPTASNVHEVAQDIAPSSRVLYADNDPMVLAHARALLTSAPEGRTAYINADLRDPAAILSDPVTRDVLDFSQPIALMLVAILHFVPDEDKPDEILTSLLDALPSGSYLVASHATAEHSQVDEAVRAYRDASIPMSLRDSADFARLAFSGLELVPPGVVLVSEWRADNAGPRPLSREVNYYGGVARKRLCCGREQGRPDIPCLTSCAARRLRGRPNPVSARHRSLVPSASIPPYGELTEKGAEVSCPVIGNPRVRAARVDVRQLGERLRLLRRSQVRLEPERRIDAVRGQRGQPPPIRHTPWADWSKPLAMGAGSVLARMFRYGAAMSATAGSNPSSPSASSRLEGP
jgi:hypothetical protein